MIKIIGSESRIGSNLGLGYASDLEGPEVSVKIKDFYISKTAVSNREFQNFVLETRYITQAEEFGNSFVFDPTITAMKGSCCDTGIAWWKVVEGACWNKPQGPHGSLEGLLDHPVVHVTLKDALAYCEWAGLSLPTELEWEYAARGGSQTIFPWGDELVENGTFRSNNFQGVFPYNNLALDGFEATAPVESFPPNDYGLYQMIGNVWEWQCHRGGIPLSNLKDYYEGGNLEDIAIKDSQEYAAARGGSYLCHESYCNRYRVAARSSFKADTSSSNMGFRVMKRKQ